MRSRGCDLAEVFGEGQTILGAAAFTPDEHAVLAVSQVLRTVNGVSSKTGVMLHHDGKRPGGRRAGLLVVDHCRWVGRRRGSSWLRGAGDQRKEVARWQPMHWG